MKEHAKTIKELCTKNAAVVVLAHQSRPGKKDFISLKQHAKLLNKFVKIKFVDDVIGKKAVNAIKKLKYGEALLLDNVRFIKEEYNIGRNKFIKTLLPYFDIFVLDAFSVAHRNEASVSGFPFFIKSCIGRVFERELKHADMLIKKSNFISVLGGIKIEDYFDILNYFLKKNIAKKILTTGVLAQLFLIASGMDIGETKIFLKEKKIIRYVPTIKLLLKKYRRKIEIPVDVAIDINGKRKEMLIENLPSKYIILDIGRKTIKRYTDIIKKSRAVFLKGVAGVYERKNYGKGTKMILKSIELSKGYSFVCGGHSSEAVDYFKINKNKISYISLSGGAMLKYLAGKKLYGLEALKHGI